MQIDFMTAPLRASSIMTAKLAMGEPVGSCSFMRLRTSIWSRISTAI